MEQTAEVLEKARKLVLPTKIHGKFLLGFDGYLDNLVSVVRVRHSSDRIEIMTSMKEWAQRIEKVAGSSSSIERVVKGKSLGGFTCNVGKALAQLSGVTGNGRLVGAFGYPRIQDRFHEKLISELHCQLTTISDPGITDAYEFEDGKIMMVDFGSINNLDWARIRDRVGREQILDQFEESELWGVGYWASSPHGSNIYQGLLEEIFPCLSRTRENHLLLDLSDLQKKTQTSLSELVSLLPQFEEFAPCILLLNDKEQEILARFLKIPDRLGSEQQTAKIHEILNLRMVVCHDAKFATVAGETGSLTINNAFTEHPKFTTSAGDHFTAGVGYGLLAKVESKLLGLLGNCATSYFVRTGQSPTAENLNEMIRNYSTYLDTGSNGLIRDIS